MLAVASPFPNGAPAPAIAGAVTGSTATIYIRFLGYDCSHCVRQLVYLNEYADQLAAAGIRVVAFSDDDPKRTAALVRVKGLDPRVFTVLSDADRSRATSIRAIRTENNEELDLHAAIVVRNNQVRFSAYGTEPFMNIEALVQAAVNTPQAVVEAEGPFSEYLNHHVVETVVAGPDDGINAPVDLAFNRSLLHGNDLWVVHDETNRGTGMAILYNAMHDVEKIELRKDSRANHFMWRTQALAFGDNGAFATAQNGEPGNGQLQYLFMGPTLWSSDTAIFARAYQGSQDFLASHLDMLHQAAWCLGIAHEQRNVYWVSDARNGRLYRFDFADPHEVGGTDHRDGVVRRYDGATLTPGQRGVPAHMETYVVPGADFGMTAHVVIYVDPGARAVRGFLSSTAVRAGGITAIPEQDELLKENSRYDEGSWWTLADTGLIEPVGLAVHKASRRVLVGDRATGRIHIYERMSSNELRAKHLGTIQTSAEELLGLEVDSTGRIWYVDRAKHQVVRLDVGKVGELTLSENTLVLDSGESRVVMARYTNMSTSTQDVTIDVASNEWLLTVDISPVHSDIAPGVSIDIPIAITMMQPSSWHDMKVNVRVSQSGSHLASLRQNVLVAGSGTDRIVVDDATEEDYYINADVPSRYFVMSSSVYLRLHDHLPNVKTLAWHVGSFGRLSPVDEAILDDLLDKNTDILLTGDDPLILRSEQPQSSAFFMRFGATFKGSDGGDTTDDGRRMLDGVVNDPITKDMRGIDCQLPRLKHHRGGWLVPAVRFAPGTQAASPFLQKRASDTTYGVRFEVKDRRTALLGINLVRILDRNEIRLLNSILLWLEGGWTVPVSVNDEPGSMPAQLSCVVRDGIVTVYNAFGLTDVALYTLNGSRVATVFEGTADGTVHAPLQTSSLSNGTYFIVARTDDGVAHASMVNRR
jgi:peroxiredoxin